MTKIFKKPNSPNVHKKTDPLNVAASDEKKTKNMDFADSLKTRIVGFDGSNDSAGSLAESDIPVVGWLAVVDGPGKGKSVPVKFGQNRVGRGKQMEIILDFGDDGISRDAAAIIVYEPKSNIFFIERGDGRNLPYVNGAVVRKDRDLEAYDRIEIGKTHLVFVPLCSEKFTWNK